MDTLARRPCVCVCAVCTCWCVDRDSGLSVHSNSGRGRVFVTTEAGSIWCLCPCYIASWKLQGHRPTGQRHQPALSPLPHSTPDHAWGAFRLLWRSSTPYTTGPRHSRRRHPPPLSSRRDRVPQAPTHRQRYTPSRHTQTQTRPTSPAVQACTWGAVAGKAVRLGCSCTA